MKIDTSKYNLTSAEEENIFQALVGPKDRWQHIRDLQVGILEKFGLEPHHRFLDAGCGVLRLGLPVIGYLDAGNYNGIDIDRDCINAANKLLDKFDLRESKKPKVMLSRSFGRDELGDGPKMDFICSFQVFIHMNRPNTLTALDSISHLLADDGVAYITVRTFDGNERLTRVGKWRRFPIIDASLDTYIKLAGNAGLDIEQVGSLANFGMTTEMKGSGVLVLKLTKR